MLFSCCSKCWRHKCKFCLKTGIELTKTATTTTTIIEKEKEHHKWLVRWDVTGSSVQLCTRMQFARERSSVTNRSNPIRWMCLHSGISNHQMIWLNLLCRYVFFFSSLFRSCFSLFSMILTARTKSIWIICTRISKIVFANWFIVQQSFRFIMDWFFNFG